MAGARVCLDSYPHSRWSVARKPGTAQIERGFTLVELIVTMIVIGILAVTMMPRFANTAVFRERRFYDATLAILRYAQKSAVAQRRIVCVTFAANSSITLTIDTNFNDGGACQTPLTGPAGGAPHTLAPTADVTFTAVPANFTFLPSGAASADRVMTVSGMPATPITVVAATGNVF
jgi:MSHA pilin protein MshC